MDPLLHSVYSKFVHRYNRLPTETDPDYLEMLHMSKYRITDVPMYKPGKCANCGSSKNDGRKYIDFGLEVDWYGTVFLCGLCLNDVAEAMELFSALRTDLVTASLELKRLRDLRDQGVNLHETVVSAFKELEVYYASLHSISVDSAPDTDSDLGDEKPAVESSVSEAKPRATKSTASSRRSDVPSLASLLGNDATK